VPIPSCGPQDVGQQRCLLVLGKAFRALAKSAAKLAAACVTGGAKGIPGALACLDDDPRGKLATAAGKVQRASDQRCMCATCTVPDFGLPADVAAATSAVAAAVRLVTTDVFGTAADLGLLTSSANATGSRCQQTVYRDVQKLGAASWSTFLECLKDGLRGRVPSGEPFVLASELTACVGQDPKGKIARARDRIATDAASLCVSAGVPLGVFGGSCGSQPSAAAFAACVAAATETRIGAAIMAAHGL
jgi:hypothetical protein